MIAPPAPVPEPLLRLQQAHPVVTARLGALFGIFYVNLILTIVTFGIYRFWAKTRLRRYVWRHVEIGGEGFEYTGTGKELLIGFLLALAILMPFFTALGIVQLLVDDTDDLLGRDPHELLGYVQFLIPLLLYPVGSYAARRYRMSRTTWGGIRFYQAGSPFRYAGLYLKGWLLTLLTLSVYLPYLQMSLVRYETANLHLGSQPFRFDGAGGALIKRWLLALLLLLPTLGLSLVWYHAARLRYVASQTRLDGLTVAMPIRGRNLIGFYLINALILAVTLGLAYPVVIRRNLTFYTRWLSLDGQIDLAAVRQTGTGPRSGEGLANFLDLDFLGV